MSNHPTSLGLPECERSTRCGRVQRLLGVIAISLVAASGCGLGQSALLPQKSVQIIRGKDSAGAIVELEKRGDDLTAARVIDVVLGTGEGDIISTTDRRVDFAIEFPAGPTITYVGQRAEDGALHDITVTGTWLQHPRGVFGADSGTWRAPSLTSDG